jgi:hypothetical protein
MRILLLQHNFLRSDDEKLRSGKHISKIANHAEIYYEDVEQQ